MLARVDSDFTQNFCGKNLAAGASGLELPLGTFRASSIGIYTKLKKGLGAVCLGTALAIISIKTMAIVEG